MAPPAVPVVPAHLGHWYIELPIYLAPVIIVAAWVKLSDRRQQRHHNSQAKPTTHERQAGNEKQEERRGST